MASVLLSCGGTNEDPATFAENIYKDNKDYLYEIIDFFDTTNIIHISTYNQDESLYKRVKDCYVYTESDEEISKDQEDKIADIAAFMTKNKIEGILQHNNGEIDYFSFTVRLGSFSIAILTYCPQNQKIKEIKEAYHSNAWYIDDSWYVVDRQDEY